LDDAASIGEAKTGFPALAADYERSYPAPAKVIIDNVDQLVAHLHFPLVHRKRMRRTDESVKAAPQFEGLWSCRCPVLLAEVGVCEDVARWQGRR
jgi:hypothetical protein